MADRKRKTPKPTSLDVLWSCRELLAGMLLESFWDERNSDLYANVNDLVADCQEDLAKRPRPRPDWLDALESLADELEEEFGDPPTTDDMPERPMLVLMKGGKANA